MSSSETNSPSGQSRFFESQAHLRSIIDTVLDAIVTIDERGGIQAVNRACERMFGYSLKELRGQNISMLMPSPFREEHDGYIQRYLDGTPARIIGIGREVEALKRDGTIFPVDLAVSEVELDGKRFFTGVMRDLTDRHRAELQLRREKNFAESLIETAHAIVLILDTSGRVVRFNHFMEHLAGYKLEEVQGRDWFELLLPVHERSRGRGVFEATLRGAAVHGNVFPILTKDGRERVIAWSGCRLVEADEVVNGVLSIGNDITELKEAERQVIQSERLAAIGQMVTGLAHESRNALQRARACLEILELDLAEQPELVRLVRRSNDALSELHRLYEEVRSYAAPMQLEIRACNLTELCSEIWEHLAVQRGGRNIRLKLNCSSPLAECDCDSQRVQQVIRNIFENSLAVVPDNSELMVKCEPAFLASTPAIRLSFRDQGPGLNAEQAERIFEPFFTTKTKGTGLGMAIARRIIEAHGGQILVGDCSQPGAEIILILPRTPRTTDSASPGSKP